MYVPLRNYTQYTIEDSVLRLSRWLPHVASHHIPAVACCDKKNLFGLVLFYQSCLKYKIKPIVGAHLAFCLTPHSRPIDLLLYARNHEGYQALSYLITLTYQPLYAKGLDIDLLQSYLQVLLVIVPPESVEACAQLEERSLAILRPLLFFGIERYPDDPKSLEQSYHILSLATQLQIPPIVLNQVYFLNPEDYNIQQIKHCIQKSYYLQDEARPISQLPHHHFYTPDALAALFHDIPIAIENSLRFAQICTLDLQFGNMRLPIYAQDEHAVLVDQAQQGLQQRFTENAIALDQRSVYDQRLERELAMITKMGFAGYFLIVADFIQWAKNHDIPVGPGRGSGAGSLVAYVLKITDIDPLPYDLLFERFLNPDRVSLPDFDVDFCMNRRDEVIAYVQSRYGVDRVSQIATFGTMAAKAVIRDVGRVLSHPFGFVDKIAKMIPFQVGITLQEALDQNPDFQTLYQNDDQVSDLIDIALKLEGLPRNVGKHAGGVVISPVPLHEICPLYNEAGGPWHPITQLDKDDVESMGLLKFDFLGLKTLTVIHATYKNAQSIDCVLPIGAQLNLCDQASYALMSTGKTIGVFQVESRGFRDLITRVKPDCFEDIIALVALYRPGPLQSGMVDDFIDRKHGLAPIVYPHPLVEGILKPTYGIILYQEQVMQIAQVLAGYSLGGADLLRRAMGKKKAEEMNQQRAVFMQGAQAQGVDPKVAEGLFDLMENFAGYGFNKSHAAAYALIVYQTLYLKTHAPAPFFAATMTADQDNLEKLAVFVEEVRDLKVKLNPPCINASQIHFFAKSLSEIQYGLGAIKGLGEHALHSLMQNRQDDGPYDSFLDFMKRISQTPLSRKHIEILIKVGAFDRFQPNRRALLTRDLPQLWDRFHKGHFAQQGLFDDENDRELLSSGDCVEDDLWSQRIAIEKQLLGISLSGTSFDPYRFLASALWKSHFVSPHFPILAHWVSSRTIRTQKGTTLVATQWRCSAGSKMEYYLNPSKPHDQDLLAKIEVISHDRPLLIYCDTLPASDNRKERIILKNIVTITDYIERGSFHLLLTVQQADHSAVVDFFKRIEQHSFSCPLRFEQPFADANSSYGQRILQYHAEESAMKPPMNLLNFIEYAYPLKEILTLRLVPSPKH